MNASIANYFRILVILAIATGLAFCGTNMPAYAQECLTPESDRASLRTMTDMDLFAWELRGDAARKFVADTGGEEPWLATVDHVVAFNTEQIDGFIIAVYSKGCRIKNGFFQKTTVNRILRGT